MDDARVGGSADVLARRSDRDIAGAVTVEVSPDGAVGLRPPRLGLAGVDADVVEQPSEIGDELSVPTRKRKWTVWPARLVSGTDSET